MTEARDQKSDVRDRKAGWTAMTKKIFCFVLCATLLALCFAAEAQQPAKIPLIGYVSASGDPNTPGPLVEAFRQGLRDLGYIEGKNILVEYRYTEGKGDRNPSLVGELVQLKVDVLVLGPLLRSAQPSRRPRQFLLSW
jgi:hypothetical protein